MLKLASKFCEEAAELISSHARREEILRRDHVPKELKPLEKNLKNEKKNQKKKQKVARSGYHLFLESKVKELKNLPEYASNV